MEFESLLKAQQLLEKIEQIKELQKLQKEFEKDLFKQGYVKDEYGKTYDQPHDYNLCDNEYLFDVEQIKQLSIGIKKGLDISKYAVVYENWEAYGIRNPKCPVFSAEEMEQIRIGLEHEIDVEKYTSFYIEEQPLDSLEYRHVYTVFEAEQMREIREKLELEKFFNEKDQKTLDAFKEPESIEENELSINEIDRDPY